MISDSQFANIRKCVKVFHLISAGVWIGGTATLTALICLYHPDSPQGFEAHNRLLRIVEVYIIAPGAAGCFITGAIYAFKYKFGVFRLKWVLAKWVLNIGFIAIGVWIMLPWIDNAIAISGSLSVVSEETAAIQAMHIFINIAQWAVIVFLVALSVFKPGAKKNSNPAQVVA